MPDPRGMAKAAMTGASPWLRHQPPRSGPGTDLRTMSRSLASQRGEAGARVSFPIKYRSG
jgi:hypothetical protein